MSEKIFGEHYVDYILGSLEPRKMAELSKHLDGCPECRRNLAELEETLHSLPLALEPQAPPPELKERILREIQDRPVVAPFQKPPEKTSRPAPSTNLWRVWAIAASILAVVGLAVSFQLYQSGQTKNANLASLRSEVEQLRQSNLGLQLKVRDLVGPDVRYLNLAGLKGFEGVSGSAFVRPDNAAASVFFHSLPALQTNQAYQLWVIEPGNPPHPSNVFQSSGEITEVDVQLPIAGDQVAALAITIEPSGGSPQPTGSMVALGQFPQGG